MFKTFGNLIYLLLPWSKDARLNPRDSKNAGLTFSRLFALMAFCPRTIELLSSGTAPPKLFMSNDVESRVNKKSVVFFSVI